MVILYGVGLVLALLTGGAIGVLVTAAHYEQIAFRRWVYEKEVAESRAAVPPILWDLNGIIFPWKLS